MYPSIFKETKSPPYAIVALDNITRTVANPFYLRPPPCNIHLIGPKCADSLFSLYTHPIVSSLILYLAGGLSSSGFYSSDYNINPIQYIYYQSTVIIDIKDVYRLREINV